MRRILLAALAALAACQEPRGPCDRHLDCNPGQQCSGGVCVALDTDHQVGSRCVRESDCARWADCTAGLCTLAPGMCAGEADCQGWQDCSPASQCVTAAGFCGGESECSAWQDCTVNHTCVLASGMCGTTADCAGWQVCDATHHCALAPNGCMNEAGCAGWQDCVAFRCATAAGFCADDGGCAAWEDCGADHVCALTAGMCGSAADCASWQACGVDHVCATADGFCADDTACAAWEDCGADHRCAPVAGACNVEADCATWQDCTDHACTLAPGMCGAETDCPAWKSCAANRCELDAGSCESHADCLAWQYCGTGHACADVGATCAGDPDCEAWQACASGHCVNRSGRCGTTPECDPAWQVCDATNVCVAAEGRCATSMQCAAWENCTDAHVCGPAAACGGAGSCAADEICSGGFCTAAASMGDDDIVLFGMVQEARAGWNGVAPLKRPTQVSVGFSRPSTHNDARTAYLDSSGNVVYAEFVDAILSYELRRFVPDSLVWTYEWDRPPDPLSNDPIVPTPGCPDGVWPYDWRIQPVTDAIVYSCDVGTPVFKYYDTAGNLVLDGYRLHAWRADGLMLGEAADALYVITPGGAATAVAGASLVAWDVATARAHLDGFRVVLQKYASLEAHLLFIDAAGVVTDEGIYPAAPWGVTRSRYVILDSTGAAFAIGSQFRPSALSTDVVIRCPVAPGVCTVEYDEVNLPATDLTATPPHLSVWIHGAALVAKP